MSIAALYVAHQAGLLRMLTGVVGDVATAEDVCQDAFVAVLCHESEPDSTDLVAWLYHTAQQLGLEARDSCRALHQVSLTGCRHLAAPPVGVSESSPEAAILRDLPVCWRAALLLQALGYTRADTAVFLCCTVTDVRNYLDLARRFLWVYGSVAPRRGRPPGKQIASALVPRGAEARESPPTQCLPARPGDDATTALKEVWIGIAQ